jgi:hypothetical protein
MVRQAGPISPENRAAVSVPQCEPEEIRRSVSGQLLEPRGGWQLALEDLVCKARCPWCGYRMLNLSASPEHGVTWSCYDGCNP